MIEGSDTLLWYHAIHEVITAIHDGDHAFVCPSGAQQAAGAIASEWIKLNFKHLKEIETPDDWTILIRDCIVIGIMAALKDLMPKGEKND